MKIIDFYKEKQCTEIYYFKIYGFVVVIVSGVPFGIIITFIIIMSICIG